MRKILVVLLLFVFAFSNLAFARRSERTGGRSSGQKTEQRVRTEKKEMSQKKEKKEKKEKKQKKDKKQKKEKKSKKDKKGKKDKETPKGVKKAAEKGKGEKKGLMRKWFDGIFGRKDKVEKNKPAGDTEEIEEKDED